MEFNQSIAMARGTLVLDENLEHLAAELQAHNIRVLKVPKGTTDDDLIDSVLANRIILTNNSKDFVDSASSLDLGIIATEQLKDTSAKAMVKKISEAIIYHSLWSKRHGFIVRLQRVGPGVFQELTI